MYKQCVQSKGVYSGCTEPGLVQQPRHLNRFQHTSVVNSFSCTFHVCKLTDPIIAKSSELGVMSEQQMLHVIKDVMENMWLV